MRTRKERFFVPEDWIARSAEAFSIPAGSLHKQITTVLRMKPGDSISLMTNDGSEIEGRITEITRSAVMGVIAGTMVPSPLTPNIIVCAAFTKRDTFEWMLEKCTELGASEFIPLITDRVVKRPKELPPRLGIITKEASEQSGRVTLPTLRDPMTLGEAIGYTDDAVRILFHPSETPSKFPVIHKTSTVALFIGPEGGFTEPEVTAARDAGAHIVTMGDLILRAETAAVAAVTRIRFS